MSFMKLTEALHSQRVLIRNYEAADLDFVTGMWLDKENGKYMSDPTRDHVDEAFQKALDELQDSQFGYYLIVEHANSGERLGSACAFPDEEGKTYDIGYCIYKNHWKQGYGTEAVKLLIEWLRTIGARAITAEVAVENMASCALLSRLGFAVEKETEFKKYNMDVHFKSHIYRKEL